MKYIELNNQVMQLKPNGFFNLEKDKEAVLAFIEEDVIPKTVKFENNAKRVEFLAKNDYYYPELLNEYSIEQIEEISNLVYSYGYEFQSYTAISKFYKDYALKTNDKKGYLETYEDRIVASCLFLGRGDFEKAMRKARIIGQQCYQPATPTFLNSCLSRRGELISCFLLAMDDSLNSIFFYINTSGQLSKIGGGVANNLNNLRSRGEEIKGIANAASGVVPVMKLLEDTFSYANQLGQRKGAGAAYLSLFHEDIVEFLDTKKINADEKSRIQTLSIGVLADQVFFDLAAKNEDLYAFGPHSVYKEYGLKFDDIEMDKMYYELLGNPNVRKRKIMSAREMFTKISQIQLESGYPYWVFKTNANEQHPLKRLGKIKMSNLCTEIFQLQELSTINDYGEPDVLGRDVNCNLGSLNIVNVMEKKLFRESVHVAIESLTAVSDMSNVSNAPTVAKANRELHSVGLGAMNLHGFLAKNHIDYESKEAREFTSTFFMMMNYYSLEKSMLIAKERNETFLGFELSDYATGEYFDDYLVTSYAPTSEIVLNLFEGHDIPTLEDWEQLKEDVQEYGLYNGYRLAVAPTQSIAYIQHSTPSISPIVSQIESRTYANSTTYYPMPYMDETNFWYYKSAYDMNQYRILDLVAAAQRHVDQGISTILYVKDNISTRELSRYYIYANKIGLKSLYYTRTRNATIEECITCSV